MLPQAEIKCVDNLKIPLETGNSNSMPVRNFNAFDKVFNTYFPLFVTVSYFSGKSYEQCRQQIKKETLLCQQRTI